MKDDKYFEYKAGGLLFGGIVLILLTLRNADTLSLIAVVLIFMICGFLAGESHANDRYKKMHHTSLEAEAKKRREADEKLWKEARDAVKEYDKKHS